MDHTETKLVQDEMEGSAVDFNSANRIRNKTLRRAQVRKDKRQKNKVCGNVRHQQLRVYLRAYYNKFQIILTFYSDFLCCHSVFLIGQQRNCGLIPTHGQGN
jgi:hypothetical protein